MKGRRRRPMTPVRVGHGVTLPGQFVPAAGRREEWSAVSLDGLWRYERLDEPGTPWVAVFLPTGQEQRFGSLPAARRWTASPDAVPFLRAEAQQVIDVGGRRGEVRYPLDDFGRPYRYEVPEDPDECTKRVEQARRIVTAIDTLEAQHAA